MNQKVLRIGFVGSSGWAQIRCAMLGFKTFATLRPQWVVVPFGAEVPTLTVLQASHCDGFIARVFNHALAERLHALGQPVVNVSVVLPNLPFARVGVDLDQDGRLAAKHFLDRGVRHFGFVGRRGHFYSDQREAGFCQELAAAGHSVECYYEATKRQYRHHSGLLSLEAGLKSWLGSLPKVAGVFACNDVTGFQTAEACRLAGLRVPEDVAIVGADNDDVLCELARPSLSSVAVASKAVGYQAAAMLDRLLEGDPPPRQPLLLPPIGIVTRQSSDLLCLPDPDVAAAVCFIREHGHMHLCVEDILREVPVSRRSLERRFRKVLGRGLGTEIRRVHVQRAKQLLASTGLPMSEVACQSGFSDSQQFSRVFHEETAVTPSAYRRQFQGQL